MRLGVDYRTVVLSACLLLPAGSVLAQATSPPTAAGIKRTPIYKGPVAAADHEAVIVKIELPAGGHAARHTHPGDEISYMVDGELELTIAGQPPVRLKAGDGISIPAGKVHEARNLGSTPAHLIGVYVVEKGKPLAAPAK
jgi:quercetin dioxygenase-like cupin family protein